MIYLFLSVASTTLLFLIFKYFEKYDVQTLPAIVVNYVTAMLMGWFFVYETYSLHEIFQKSWSIPMTLIGVLFIYLFLMMAITAQKMGVSVATVASKMSLAIPVIIFIIIDKNESISILKVLGLVLALVGVYFASSKDTGPELKVKFLMYPLIIFIGSGIIDLALGFFSSAKFMQVEADSYLLTAFPFLGAALAGLLVLLYQSIFQKKFVKMRDFLGGLILGVVNFSSIYFLVRALGSGMMEKSSIIPINNMGVVALTAIMSIILFREYLTLRNKIGIALAVISIALIAFA